MTTALLVAALLSLVYGLRFCAAPVSLARSMVKTGSVVALALAAWLGSGPLLLIVALLLCALGDWLLSRDGEAVFMAGVGAFAAGHIAYVALFLTRPETGALTLTTPLSLGLVALGVIMAVLLWSRAGALNGPVTGYIPIILSMGIAAQSLPSTGALSLALPAALLFIVSDITLAFEMFVLRAGSALRRIAPRVVWPTYWIAQLGLMLAFTG